MCLAIPGQTLETPEGQTDLALAGVSGVGRTVNIGRLVEDGLSVGEVALAALRSHPFGREAAIIGTVRDDPAGLVLLKTQFGGSRIVDLLVGDPLPRIC